MTDVIRLNDERRRGPAGPQAGRIALLTEHGLDLYARLSPDGVFEDISTGLEALLGLSLDQLRDVQLRDVVDTEDAEAVEGALTRLGPLAGERQCVTVRMIQSVTETAWVELRLIRDSETGGGGVLVAGRDVTEHRRREEELERAAAHDALTGLPNQALLSARIEHAFAQRRRSGTGFALGVADIDEFKRVNDSLGHAVGDSLLRQIAIRLRGELRAVDTIARTGGDEFVFVLPGVETPEQTDGIVRRLADAMQLPFLVGRHTLFVTFSMGLALHPEHASDAATLIHCADAALYRAKDLGRNRWQLFTADLAVRRSQYLELEHAMFEAVRNGEFSLNYQPISRTDGTIVGAEALMRWTHPSRGVIPPTEFIPVAEANGLIALLGDWALRTACMQAVRWDGAGLAGLSVSVNVSPRQFRQGEFFDQVKQALRESGLEPPRLVLEITEGVLLQNPEHARVLLDTLKGLGVRIAVDDFGTGYSSLAYLKRFPLSSLKIDRSFVRDMAQSANDRVIVSAVLSLARELGLQAVAEGVEDAGQLSFLREKGCPLVQGYYIGMPMPAPEFERAVRAAAARVRSGA